MALHPQRLDAPRHQRTDPRSVPPPLPGECLSVMAAEKRRRRGSAATAEAPRPGPPPLPSGHAVPPLEPPAPLAMRAAPGRVRRKWFGQRLHEAPCWLMSMLLHLAAIVVLSSLVVPLGEQTALIPLVLTLIEADEAAQGDSTMHHVIVVQDPLPDDRSKDETPAEKPAQDDAPPPESRPVRDEPVVDGAGVAKATFEFLCGVVDTVEPLAPPPPAEPVVDLAPREERKKIVDDFIRFDIGKLNGVAGQQAQRRFQELGPEAIPSLVYGLNESAKYHQSCPVCVISGKLDSALSACDDPAMIAYALEHIGDGVDPNAPHAARIEAQRARWSRRLMREREMIAADLAARGMSIDEDLITRVRESMPLGIDEIASMLDQPDRETRLAATLALAQHGRGARGGTDASIGLALAEVVEDADFDVSAVALDTQVQLAGGLDLGTDAQAWREHWGIVATSRDLAGAPFGRMKRHLESSNPINRRSAAKTIAHAPKRFADGERLQFGRRLTTMLNDADPAVRPYAQQALKALAGGEQANTATAWQRYWDTFETQRVIGPRADAMLTMARVLEDHGRDEYALRRYQKVIDEFPNTAAAEAARQRLGQR